MHRLHGIIQYYPWGSRTVIAELQGRASPAPRTEAELWLGAHPNAPSLAETPAGLIPLDQLIAADPSAALGERVADDYGRLPFLVKVLAAAKPLSLQAHPSQTQAQRGFAAEEAAGVPRDAAHRNYKDASHKPELLCALTNFDALCGFREPSETAALFAAIGSPRLTRLAAELTADDGLRVTLAAILTEPKPAELVDEVVAACARLQHGPWREAAALALTLARRYPRDRGVVAALLLNRVRLQPSQALYLPAGKLHAYLSGAGVELMASSDNVLRGGLTGKHVDVRELLDIVDCHPYPCEPILSVGDAQSKQWPSSANEFRLWRLTPEQPITLEPWGPEILLCMTGSVTVTSAGSHLHLCRGESAFICGGDSSYELNGAGAELYRITVAAIEAT